jgi:uncharacterized membrane-anchored protein
VEKDPQAELWSAMQSAMQHGPDVIALGEQGALALPEGYSFIPKKEGATIMDLLGNPTDASFLGLVTPDRDASWFAALEYEASGHIEDDEAKDWDTAELLENLREGTRAANQQRSQQGLAQIEVSRWVEAPNYDAGQHRLVWSAEARKIGEQDADPVINYNTYVLGRDGYLSLNLVTSRSRIEADKTSARALLSGITFNAGNATQTSMKPLTRGRTMAWPPW